MSTRAALSSALADGAVIVDVRGADRAEAVAGVYELVEGSLSAPWDRQSASLPTAMLPTACDTPMVVHCKSGKRANEVVSEKHPLQNRCRFS